jgi:putative membrane protein
MLAQVANVFVVLIALLHVYILVLEMFLWRTPRARAAFGTTAEFAQESATMAANQGLYNGFLAAGLVVALVAGGPATDLGAAFAIFFLLCVLVAGIYGAVTVSVRILLVQSVPAAVGLVLVLLAR